MKKLLLLLCIFTFLFQTVAFAEQKSIEATTMGITLVVDNRNVYPVDSKDAVAIPFIYDGTTYVPVRLLAESLGKDIEWDNDKKIISIKDKVVIPNTESLGVYNNNVKTPNKLTLKVDYANIKVYINDILITPVNTQGVVVEPFTLDGTTYAPVRAISQAVGKEVTWDNTNKIVYINDKGVAPILSKNPEVTITMMNNTTIVAELYPDMAINTVGNFIDLIEKKFYDKLTFHRIVPDFMIQGGCPLGTGTGNAGYNIPGEFNNNMFYNPLSHKIGTLSMARSNNPDSASSQFFICVADSTHLDSNYAAFGRVVSGLENAIKISLLSRDDNDKPLSPVTIKTITVNKYDFSIK